MCLSIPFTSILIILLASCFELLGMLPCLGLKRFSIEGGSQMALFMFLLLVLLLVMLFKGFWATGNSISVFYWTYSSCDRVLLILSPVAVLILGIGM